MKELDMNSVVATNDSTTFSTALLLLYKISTYSHAFSLHPDIGVGWHWQSDKFLPSALALSMPYLMFHVSNSFPLRSNNPCLSRGPVDLINWISMSESMKCRWIYTSICCCCYYYYYYYYSISIKNKGSSGKKISIKESTLHAIIISNAVERDASGVSVDGQNLLSVKRTFILAARKILKERRGGEKTPHRL